MYSPPIEMLPVFFEQSELVFVVNRPETHKQVLTVFNPYEFPIQFTVLSNAPSKYRVAPPRGFIRPKSYIDLLVRCLMKEITGSTGSGATHAGAHSNERLRVEIYREDDPSTPCGRKEIPLIVTQSDVGSRSSGGRNPETDAAPFVSCFPLAQQKGSSDGSSTGGYGSMEARYGGKSSCSPISALRQRFAGGASSPGSTGASFGVHGSSSLIPALPGAQQNTSFYWVALVALFACALTLALPTSPQQTPSQYAEWVPEWLRPSHAIQLVACYVLGLLTMYFFASPLP